MNGLVNYLKEIQWNLSECNLKLSKADSHSKLIETLNILAKPLSIFLKEAINFTSNQKANFSSKELPKYFADCEKQN